MRAPSLNGLYMSPVPLADGSTVIADDRYIHDSIVYPKEQVVASYAPVMPSFDKRHRRGGPGEDHRLHQVAGAARRAGGQRRDERDAARDLATVEAEHETYLTDEKSIWSWLLTTDHKRIALLYFASITAFFFLGGAAAALMRLNLMSPHGLIASHETVQPAVHACMAW